MLISLPCLPFQPCTAKKLVNLRLGFSKAGSQSFAFCQGSFRFVRFLEFMNVSLDCHFRLSRFVPSLNTLVLSNCTTETVTAQQIFTGLKAKLKKLCIQYCHFHRSFISTALPIIGPSLESFEIDGKLWTSYFYSSNGATRKYMNVFDSTLQHYKTEKKNENQVIT